MNARDNDQQIIKREKQRFSQFNDNGFFYGGQRGLQDVWTVRKIFYRIPFFPFSDGILGDIILPSKSSYGKGRLADFSSDCWGCACSFMKIYIHAGSIGLYATALCLVTTFLLSGLRTSAWQQKTGAIMASTLRGASVWPGIKHSFFLVYNQAVPNSYTDYSIGNTCIKWIHPEQGDKEEIKKIEKHRKDIGKKSAEFSGPFFWRIPTGQSVYAKVEWWVLMAPDGIGVKN